MKSKLAELEEKIFFGDHSDEEWRQFNKEVDKELAVASEKEKQRFMDSGAGDLITQIMEYMD